MKALHINRPKFQHVIYLIFLSLGFTSTVLESDSTDTIPIKSDFIFREVKVTASRISQEIHDVPKIVYALDQNDIRGGAMPRTMPELFAETPGIMVQKTGNGQGSPHMRGFTGFRTLFLIDGVRLNNSVFRDGPNQYWNTVDAMSIYQLEVLMGANSSLYGSDAVGGVVNAKTQPLDFNTKKSIKLSRLYTRMASAEGSNIARLEMIGSPLRLFNYQIGYTHKKFGDLVGGKEVGKQPKTGYAEWDGDIKLMFKLNPNSTMSLLYQNVHINDAWRTHKTIYGITWMDTQHGSEIQRDLDHARDLTILHYNNHNPGFGLDALTLSGSYHHQFEERYRVKSSYKGETQGFDVYTAGFNVQAEKKSKDSWVVFGLDFYNDIVSSYKTSFDAEGNTSIKPQGPIADNASYRLMDYFLQFDRKFLTQFHLQSGYRYSSTMLHAGKVFDPLMGNVFSFNRNWAAGSGNINIFYDLFNDHHYNLFAGIAQSFRAPNLSDMTRFDSARSNEVEIPTLDIDPEFFTSYEIGLKIREFHYFLQMAFSYTDIQSMIIRTPTGETDEDGNVYVAKKNSGNGFTQSVELSALVFVTTELSFSCNGTLLDGKVDTYPTSDPVLVREPIDRLMPATGQVGIKWNPVNKKYWLEGIVNIAGKQNKLSTRDMSDVQRIPVGGTPGYSVFSVRSGYQLNHRSTVGLNIENISNVDYRTHGSGLNQPGTNVIVNFDYKF